MLVLGETGQSVWGSLNYFLELHVNLQLSQNFNWEEKKKKSQTLTLPHAGKDAE